MNIINVRKPTYHWRQLDRICIGSTVKFRSAFHQDVCRDDLFLVVGVCGSYRPESTHGKSAVVNMNTNKLSYVASNRDVRIVKCEVHVDD